MSLALAIAFLALAAAAAGIAALVELRAWRREAAIHRLLTLFAPGLAAARQEPRALLVWQPLAATARRLMPEAFAALDRAAGGRFPFSSEQVQAAHAKWTADWLAWERAHDSDCRLRVAELEDEIARGGSTETAATRAKRETLEREKLERYQQRYEEYIKVAKALAALDSDAGR